MLFYCYTRNRGDIIQRLMLERGWKESTKETDILKGNVNFIWKDIRLSHEIYQHLASNNPQMRNLMLNHFQFNTELTNKSYLQERLNNYYTSKDKKHYNPLSPSYDIQSMSLSNDNNYKQFRQKFKDIEEKQNALSPYPQIHCRYNLWIIKPTNLNRAQGIFVSSSLSEIEKFLSTNNLKTKFLIQKYLEQPLLYKGRKNDIRVYVLIDSDAQVFIYNEGFLRCSSCQYSPGNQSPGCHITNINFQKKKDEALVNEFLQSNDKSELVLYNSKFARYLEETYSDLGLDYNEHIKPQMIDIIIDAFLSTGNGINPKNLNCFELFSFDFMIDTDFRVWLVEVNTNPSFLMDFECVQDPLPFMLDEMLNLTVDKAFPHGCKNRKIYTNQNRSEFDLVYSKPLGINKRRVFNYENIYPLYKIQEVQALKEIKEFIYENNQNSLKHMHKKSIRLSPIKRYDHRNTANLRSIYNTSKDSASTVILYDNPRQLIMTGNNISLLKEVLESSKFVINYFSKLNTSDSILDLFNKENNFDAGKFAEECKFIEKILVALNSSNGKIEIPGLNSLCKQTSGSFLNSESSKDAKSMENILKGKSKLCESVFRLFQEFLSLMFKFNLDSSLRKQYEQTCLSIYSNLIFEFQVNSKLNNWAISYIKSKGKNQYVKDTRLNIPSGFCYDSFAFNIINHILDISPMHKSLDTNKKSILYEIKKKIILSHNIILLIECSRKKEIEMECKLTNLSKDLLELQLEIIYKNKNILPRNFNEIKDLRSKLSKPHLSAIPTQFFYEKASSDVFYDEDFPEVNVNLSTQKFSDELCSRYYTELNKSGDKNALSGHKLLSCKQLSKPVKVTKDINLEKFISLKSPSNEVTQPRERKDSSKQSISTLQTTSAHNSSQASRSVTKIYKSIMNRSIRDASKGKTESLTRTNSKYKISAIDVRPKRQEDIKRNMNYFIESRSKITKAESRFELYPNYTKMNGFKKSLSKPPGKKALSSQIVTYSKKCD